MLRSSLGKTAPEGKPLSASRPRSWRWLRRGFLFLFWMGVGLGVFFLSLLTDLPRPENARAVRRPSLVLEDAEGRVFARFGDIAGEPVRLAELPPYVPEAVVAIEDRRFFSHGPLDFYGLARALLTDLVARRVVEGGSTLTQQVAKTLFLSNRRTFRRKFQELLLSFWLYDHFSRTEILEIYLNRVYLGSGAIGIDAAARVYFGIPARQLSLWQAALLAGLPRAPARLNPRANPAAALARARTVLTAMVRAGYISPAEAERAAAAMHLPDYAIRGAGWFATWVAERYQSRLPAGADAELRTTLDSRLEAEAQTALDTLLATEGERYGVSEGAIVVLDAETGAVRALIGGRGEGGGFNRAVLARRQPGSAFKPIIWLNALEHGETPESLVLDAPLRLGTWAPQDIEHRYLGPITLTEALARSSNTAAVRLLLRDGGPKAAIALARRLGIDEDLPQDATLALGTGAVSLLSLTLAYAPFFNGGHRISAEVEVGHPAIAIPVLPPEEAAAMRTMLRSVVESGTGTAARLPGVAVAGKTGTSQDYRDAWFIGAVGHTLIGVWLGNDDERPMRGVTGGSLPARLFREVAAAILRRSG
jgi:penicillin-binding protein 1A